MKRREFIQGLRKGGAAAACMSLGGGLPGILSAKEEPTAEAARAKSHQAAVLGVRDPRIEVDLAAIGRNLDRVHKRTRVPVMGVVKANAYGHGLVEVARYLESAGLSALIMFDTKSLSLEQNRGGTLIQENMGSQGRLKSNLLNFVYFNSPGNLCPSCDVVIGKRRMNPGECKGQDDSEKGV